MARHFVFRKKTATSKRKYMQSDAEKIYVHTTNFLSSLLLKVKQGDKGAFEKMNDIYTHAFGQTLAQHKAIAAQSNQ